MIGVCIGVGGEWAALAEKSAASMEMMTGVKCQVIRAAYGFDCCHPSWLKCHLHRIFPDQEAFLVFDADLLAIRPWDPQGLFEQMGRPFMGVPEPNGNPDVRRECQDWGLGYPDLYLNCGLLVFGREHGFVMDRAWSMHPNGGRWLEQTAINYALAMEAVEVCRLPRVFNTLAQEGKVNSIYCRTTLRNAINVHTCAMESAAAVDAQHERLRAHLAAGTVGRNREDLLRAMRKHFGPGSTGAEIGVFCGDFSRDILRVLEPAQLHLVDLFEGKVTSGDVNGQHMRTVDMAVIRGELDALGEPVVTWAADSVEWLRQVGAGTLDWVYVDTTHEYERTREELYAALRAVRNGGWICGHDFSRAFPGVVRAVTEFVREQRLRLEVYDGDLLASYVIREEFGG